MLVGLTLSVAPVPSNVPPHDPLYQVQLAPVPSVPPVIPNVELPPEHIVARLAVAVVAATELLLTVIVTLLQMVLLHVPSART